MDRLQIAAMVLQGFAANPAVFASNPMNGWSLVNTDETSLAGYALMIADELIAADQNKGE